MRRIEVEVNGTIAEAELFEKIAPRATSAFWEALPLERKLITAKWSGDVVALHPNHPLLTEIVDLENPVTSIYPGTIVMRPKGTEILISFGVGEYRWAIGVDYTTLLAQITTNRPALFAALAAVHDTGTAIIAFRRK